jgi:tRNA-binding EMAP/Myf-like protein
MKTQIKNNASKIWASMPLLTMLLLMVIGGCKKDTADNNGEPANLDVPLVISTSPTNNAVEVGVSKVITANFNEIMDSLSINAVTFTLKQGTVSVTGIVNYVDKIATFTPAVNLVANKEYTATISTGAKSTGGKSLANNKVWSFTTGTNTSS